MKTIVNYEYIQVKSVNRLIGFLIRNLKLHKKAEAQLGTYQTSMIELLCENSQTTEKSQKSSIIDFYRVPQKLLKSTTLHIFTKILLIPYSFKIYNKFNT